MSKFEINKVASLPGLSKFGLLAAIFVMLTAFPSFANASEKEEEGLDVKEIIFEHLGDGYGWEVPFSHTKRIPLPVIVRAEDGQWFSFSSGDVTELVEEKDEKTGKIHEVRKPRLKTIERN